MGLHRPSATVSLPSVVVATALALACQLGPALAGDPGETYRALREAGPDGRQIVTEGLVLERDAFRLTLQSGALHLLQPVAGRTVGAVFLGQGRLDLAPADPREGRHLAMLHGDGAVTSLSDSFAKALLLFADGTADELLALGTSSGTPSAEAESFRKAMLKKQHKDYRTNFHLRLLQDLVDLDGDRPGVFLAFVDLKANPPSLVAIDPTGVENLWLGDNIARGVGGPEESALFFMGDNNSGFAYLSHTVEQIRSGRAAECRLRRVADALHYELDTRIRPDREIEGDATIRFRVTAPRLQVLPLRLMGELRIHEAVLVSGDGEGAAPRLSVIQEAPYEDVGSLSEWESSDAAVILPEPLPQGAEVSIRISYAGKEVLEDAGDDNYYVGARSSWYPNLGAFSDRATYKLTFRVPPGYEVVSVGQPVQSGTAEDSPISVWIADEPINVAGFNYGKFQRFEQVDDVSGMTIQVFTNPGTPNIVKAIDAALRARSRSAGAEFARDVVSDTAGYEGYVPGSFGPEESFGASTISLAQSALADGLNSAKVFHTYFGPLEHTRVAITQQSNWSFGQAWPSLIYLPYWAFISSTARAKILQGRANTQLTEFVDQVGLHEMAHQWWGHRVGWESYRDQWLSEGLAEFSAGFAVELIEGPQAAHAFWERRRERILETSGAAGSLRNYEVGGITQGVRASTRRTPGAYQALAYSKGAFVVHMLRMMMRDPGSPDPDARFFAMMRDFLSTYAGRNASTADFQRAIEKHMIPELNAKRDGKMDWFFDQWVHGTDVPRYKVEVTAERAGKGEYRVHGQLSQEGVSEEFMAMVPIYIDFGKGQLGMIGRAPFKGNMTQTLDRTMSLPKKPKRIVVNANHEVLALY